MTTITEEYKNLLITFNEMKDSMNDRLHSENEERIQTLLKENETLKKRNNILTDDYRELRYACSVVLKHINTEV